MASADYSGWTLDQVVAAINSGEPGSFDTAADAFKTVYANLTTLSTDIPPAVNAVVTPSGGPWSGPAAEAFKQVSTEYVAFINATMQILQPYEGAMRTAAQALRDAQSSIGAWVDAVKTYRTTTIASGGTPDEEAINAVARTYIVALANVYTQVAGQLHPVPENPMELQQGDGSGPQTDGQNSDGTTSGSSNPNDGESGTSGSNPDSSSSSSSSSSPPSGSSSAPSASAPSASALLSPPPSGSPSAPSMNAFALTPPSADNPYGSVGVGGSSSLSADSINPPVGSPPTLPAFYAGGVGSPSGSNSRDSSTSLADTMPADGIGSLGSLGSSPLPGLTAYHGSLDDLSVPVPAAHIVPAPAVTPFVGPSFGAALLALTSRGGGSSTPRDNPSRIGDSPAALLPESAQAELVAQESGVQAIGAETAASRGMMPPMMGGYGMGGGGGGGKSKERMTDLVGDEDWTDEEPEHALGRPQAVVAQA